jgi:hypothetical protein
MFRVSSLLNCGFRDEPKRCGIISCRPTGILLATHIVFGFAVEAALSAEVVRVINDVHDKRIYLTRVFNKESP